MWLFYGSSVSVRRASTGFVSSDEFDAPWTTTPWRRWSTRSFLQDRRSPQLTLYNVCWISFQTHTSTTVACRVYFMTSYTGLTSLNESSSTSSLSWSAGVWRTKLRSTWASIALRLPPSAADIYDQPTSISWLYRAVGGLHLAVGLSLLQSRASGTLYRPIFVVCPSVLATLDARWRRYCSRVISELSAIEMLCIILRYINFLLCSILLFYSYLLELISR